MAISFFQLARQVQPETSQPWFLMETTFTSDGPRSRLCDGRWTTQEEAQTELDRRKAASKASNQHSIHPLSESSTRTPPEPQIRKGKEIVNSEEEPLPPRCATSSD